MKSFSVYGGMLRCQFREVIHCVLIELFAKQVLVATLECSLHFITVAIFCQLYVAAQIIPLPQISGQSTLVGDVSS